MDHEHSADGPPECKVCETKRTGDFGQGSREQSFRGLAFEKIDARKIARG